MITLFRKLFSTRIGLFIAFAFVGLIALTFALSDVSNVAGTSIGTGERVARVGSETVNSSELVRRMQIALEQERERSPGLDMIAFAEQGGLERTLQGLLNTLAIDEFGRQQGMAISKRMIDGEIASVPAFKGPTGEFSQDLFRAAIARQGLTEAQVRRDLGGLLMERQLLVAATGAARTPAYIAERLAALALEAREGQISFVPAASAPAGPPPTDAEVESYYRRNIARYTVPETRVVRFAVFGRSTLSPRVDVSEAEIRKFYDDNPQLYGAGETRVFTQLILPDEAAAKAFAARVAGGTSFADAARAAGLSPIELNIVSRDNLEDIASKAVADAAYRLQPGELSAPARSGLGWHVVRLERIDRTTVRPFETARGVIADDLRLKKLETTLADQVVRIEDRIAEGATFDEVVAEEGLKVVTTPPILSSGRDPDNPGFDPPAFMATLLKDAFEALPDDDPIVETIQANEEYALTDLDSIIPATPRPLAQIREQVVADMVADRRHAAARAAADRIIAAAGKGAPLSEAVDAAGLPAEAPRPLGGKRQELTAGGQRVAPPLALLFSMSEGSIKRLEAPDRSGWFVIRLDRIIPGDISTAPGLAERVRQELLPIQAREYAEQFVAAMRADVGVSQDDEAVARVRRELTGAGR